MEDKFKKKLPPFFMCAIIKRKEVVLMSWPVVLTFSMIFLGISYELTSYLKNKEKKDISQ